MTRLQHELRYSRFERMPSGLAKTIRAKDTSRRSSLGLDIRRDIELGAAGCAQLPASCDSAQGSIGSSCVLHGSSV